MQSQRLGPGVLQMPNFLMAVRNHVRNFAKGLAVKVVGYGRDLTPPETRQAEAEHLEQVAAQMRRAGINTRAVQRAAEIRSGART